MTQGQASPEITGVPYSVPKILWNLFLYLFAMALLITIGWFARGNWLGWVLFGISAIILLVAIGDARNLSGHSYALVFEEAGLRDRRKEKSEQLIPWSEIRKVTVHRLKINLMTATTTLILERDDGKGGRIKVDMDMDTLKGKPETIADAVCACVNNHIDGSHLAPDTVEKTK